MDSSLRADARAVVYRYQDGLYVNLTNRCPTACGFCIKFTWKMRYRGYDLRLDNQEPTVDEVLDAVEAAGRERAFREIVFCGYGESTYRLEDMLAVCDALAQRHPGARRRLNTIGLGDLINGRSIARELAGRLDAVSVSLNTADPAQWIDIHRPLPEFRETGFAAVQEFLRECARRVADTTATAVDRPGVDVAGCRRLAESLGARWRERPHLDAYESK